jgi:hypothetical protein
VPGLQGKQLLEEFPPIVGLYLPTSQGLHDDCPLCEYFPTGQAVQDRDELLPVLGLYVPASQSVHDCIEDCPV